MVTSLAKAQYYGECNSLEVCKYAKQTWVDCRIEQNCNQTQGGYNYDYATEQIEKYRDRVIYFMQGGGGPPSEAVGRAKTSPEDLYGCASLKKCEKRLEDNPNSKHAPMYILGIKYYSKHTRQKISAAIAALIHDKAQSNSPSSRRRTTSGNSSR